MKKIGHWKQLSVASAGKRERERERGKKCGVSVCACESVRACVKD